MKIFNQTDHNNGTPILLPDTKRIWIVCLTSGMIFWFIGLVLWQQQQIDKAALFFYNAARIAYDPIVILVQWFTSYGMAAITSLFVVYLLVSRKIKSLDAPLTIYNFIRYAHMD